MYTVKKFDFVDFEWKYMNSYNTYSEAHEALVEIERRYPGNYKVFCE